MLSQIKVSLDDYYELKNIKEKVYYPLNKLVDRKNFKSILNNYKLTSGKIFPLPIFLSVEKNIAIINQLDKLKLHLKEAEIAVLKEKINRKSNVISESEKTEQTKVNSIIEYYENNLNEFENINLSDYIKLIENKYFNREEPEYSLYNEKLNFFSNIF